MQNKLILGLMSGTSFDAIDLAVLTTDGEGVAQAGAHGSRVYAEGERQVLREAMAAASKLGAAELRRENLSGVLAAADKLITDTHIEAVKKFCLQHKLAPELIGFHGQTMAHLPAERCTLQLGDAARLAAECGVDVVADFRIADVAAGGQGAPLAPLYHVALLNSAGIKFPVAVINIGGVANITFYDGENILAFDCGAGNALLDDFVCATSGAAYDKDGALAAGGVADAQLVAQWMRHEYFSQPAPKSLDRLQFAKLTSEINGDTNDTPENIAATLTAFTAAGIAVGLQTCAKIYASPREIILCGGGRHNPTLCKMIAEAADITPTQCETLNWNGDALEAQAFAYLAARSVRDLPLSLPTTTATPAPTTGGKLYRHELN